MTTSEVVYTLDNTWEKAHRRLTLLESIYDPTTRARLAALGVGPGWRCLELGAGGGSIARWLCDRVGPTGRVTAVDLEPRFLEDDPRPNMDIHRRDILTEGIPGAGYDVIHTRALLMHLPTRDELIVDLVARLRPGGVILLEEGDFFPVVLSGTGLYAEMCDRAASVAAKAGADFRWARHLPARLEAAGATGVTGSFDGLMFRGGEPWAELWAMTLEQLTPLLVADGVDPDVIAAAITEMFDPGRWFPAPAAVAASGHRPS